MAQWWESGRATTTQADELIRNETLTVGTTTTILAQGRRRQELIIANNSTAGQIIYIHRGEGEASTTNGIPIGAGMMWIETNSEGFRCTQSRVSAVSSAAGATVLVTER